MELIIRIARDHAGQLRDTVGSAIWEICDEIERLQKENTRLSAFLYPIGALINSQPTPIPTEGISGVTEEEVKEFLKEFGRD
jgi:predicted ATP-dependent protease